MEKTRTCFYHSFLLFTVFLSAIISGCESQNVSTLRLGTNIWPGYEPLYLARELALWSPKQVHLVEYVSSTDTIRAFRNNEIDAVALTLDEILLLLQDGIDLNVILILDTSLGGDVLLSRPGIAHVKDLIGQRVAVESGALGAFVLTRALELNGLKLSDVNVIHQTTNEHVHTFDNDVADAVVCYEPERSLLLKKGALQIFDSREIPGEIIDVLAVRTDYLKQNPQQIQVLLRGWFKATRYLQTNPQDAAAKMSQRLQLSKEETLSAFTGLKIPDYAENLKFLTGDTPLLVSTANKLNEIMLANKLINSSVKINSLPLSEPLIKLN